MRAGAVGLVAASDAVSAGFTEGGAGDRAGDVGPAGKGRFFRRASAAFVWSDDAAPRWVRARRWGGEQGVFCIMQNPSGAALGGTLERRSSHTGDAPDPAPHATHGSSPRGEKRG